MSRPNTTPSYYKEKRDQETEKHLIRSQKPTCLKGRSIKKEIKSVILFLFIFFYTIKGVHFFPPFTNPHPVPVFLPLAIFILCTFY